MKSGLTSVVFFSLLLILGFSGCTEGTGSSSLPSDLANPKLESRLNQLVLAEKRGELTPFIQQNNITLENSQIRVVIECVPGKVDAVIKTTNLLATVESRYENLLQVLVLPANLSRLTENEDVKFVRLPQPVQPAISQQNRAPVLSPQV